MVAPLARSSDGKEYLHLYRIVLQRSLLLRNIRLLLRLTPVFTAPSAVRRGRVAFAAGSPDLEVRRFLGGSPGCP